MARSNSSVPKHRRHRKVIAAASGYRGARSRHFRVAREQLLHSWSYAYRDRRDRKGEFRRLWIARVNAAARANGLSYNRLINGLSKAGVEVNRKMLAEIAVGDPAAFASLAQTAKKQIQ